MSKNPVRPFTSPPRLAAADHFVRAVASEVLNAAGQVHEGAENVAKRAWPEDAVTPLITRAATSPATITTSGWASPLAATSVADFIGSLGPVSAGSTLLKRGLQFAFGDAAAIFVPGVVASGAEVGFVAEGAPIPVRQYVTGGATLAPNAFKILSSFTRELSNHSTPNVEQLVKAIITQDVGLALDAALFSAAAATAYSPAGLLNAVAALTPSALTPANEAFFADVLALVAAVSPVAGNAPVVLVANPAQAASLRFRLAGQDADYEVLSSSALGAGVVVAVAANALVSAIDPQPRFDISAESVLHFEDTAPLAISATGSPNTIAAPTRSMFQTDTLALRMVFQVDWALRAPGAVGWLTTTAW